MKVIINHILPFSKKYYAINLFGIVFAKGPLSPTVSNHEYIHTMQQREMLYLFFYIAYLLEWIVRILFSQTPEPTQISSFDGLRSHFKSTISNRLHHAYLHISFEREAYSNDNDILYRHHRPHYSWIKYL